MKRLEKIIYKFKKTIEELDSLAATADQEVKSHEAEISSLVVKQHDIVQERDAALNAANNIRKLIAA